METRDVNNCGQQDKKKEKKQFNCSMMIASVWDVLIVSLELHVLCQLIMDSTTIYISDINECAPNGGLGPCAQICTNTPGSFSCSCKAGYNVSGYACNGMNSLPIA